MRISDWSSDVCSSDRGLVGGSITSAGVETISGVHVVLNGDYSQSDTGTTVVGVSPSLARFAPVSVGTANGGSEVLGPIEAGATVPFRSAERRLGKEGFSKCRSRW